MSERKRAIGSLTHADMGARVRIPGHTSGLLWSIQHVAAVGDIPHPWTRVTVRRDTPSGSSEATCGLPPDMSVFVERP